MKTLSRRRTRYEIYADLIDIVARKGFCRVTRASYGANLPVDRAKKSLGFLASRGFLKEEDRGDSKIYKITKRGLEYLESFKQMRRLFAALDEETTTPEEAKAPPHIQTKLILGTREAKINEDVDVEIELHNAGKSVASLIRVEDIVPQGFELVTSPNFASVQGSTVYLNRKELASSRTQKIRLTMRSSIDGVFTLKPRIVYVNSAGRQSSLEVKPMEISILPTAVAGRISTGFKDLDNLLLGGIPENYAIILTSTACDEKDLLIRRFLEAGTTNEQITFYVTAELMGAKNFAEMHQTSFYLFACNPQAETVIKSSPNVSKLKGVENLTDINIALTSTLRRLHRAIEAPRRACIEIISDVLLQHHAVQTRRWLTGLLPELKSEGFTILMVINPRMHSPEEVQAILGLFEGEMNIYEKESEGGSRKYLRIKKMYNQRYLENEMLLRKEKLLD